jgi:hypothetical protein
MATLYSSNLGLWLHHNAPDSGAKSWHTATDQAGADYCELRGWDENRLGPPPTPEEVAKFAAPAYVPDEALIAVDHAAEVEDALIAAKSARTVVSTISVAEAINARLAALEAKLGVI